MITTDFFNLGKTQVPLQETARGGVPSLSRKEELQSYITRYEKDFFKCLLGSQYDTYFANKTEQKWIDLEAKLLPFEKVSPVANYIFYNYYKDSNARNQPNGTHASIVKDSVNVTNARLCDVWNEMVMWMSVEHDCVLDWLSTNQDTYQLDYCTVDWGNFTFTINTLGI